MVPASLENDQFEQEEQEVVVLKYNADEIYGETRKKHLETAVNFPNNLCIQSLSGMDVSTSIIQFAESNIIEQDDVFAAELNYLTQKALLTLDMADT